VTSAWCTGLGLSSLTPLNWVPTQKIPPKVRPFQIYFSVVPVRSSWDENNGDNNGVGGMMMMRRRRRIFMGSRFDHNDFGVFMNTGRVLIKEFLLLLMKCCYNYEADWVLRAPFCPKRTPLSFEEDGSFLESLE